MNTMPEKTLDAFADHGEVEGRRRLRQGQRGHRALFDRAQRRGHRPRRRVRRAEEEGVDKFSKSWDELVETVKKQMEQA